MEFLIKDTVVADIALQTLSNAYSSAARWKKISPLIFFDLCVCFEVSFIVDSHRPLHLINLNNKNLRYLEGMSIAGKLIRDMGKKNYGFSIKKQIISFQIFIRRNFIPC